MIPKELTMELMIDANYNSYWHRPAHFQHISLAQWQNWIWQARNTINGAEQLANIFPGIPERQIHLMQAWERAGFRIKITPHLLALMSDNGKNVQFQDNPVWKQFLPVFDELLDADANKRQAKHDKARKHAETKKTMLSPITCLTDTDKICIYIVSECFGYCNYCLHAAEQTSQFNLLIYWQQTLEALSQLHDFEHILLSGGEPFIYDNAMLELILLDLKAVAPASKISILTRSLTQNPYRVDKALCSLLKKYRVNELLLHVAHPNECTFDFEDAIARIQKHSPETKLSAHTPLIKGVNDCVAVLSRLFMRLFSQRIQPKYLLHLMPNVPLASSHRTSVISGVNLMRKLSRKVLECATPTYHITTNAGAVPVPLNINGTPDFQYIDGPDGQPIIKFKNKNGKLETYIDAKD